MHNTSQAIRAKRTTVTGPCTGHGHKVANSLRPPEPPPRAPPLHKSYLDPHPQPGHPPTDSTPSPLLERLRSFTNLCNNWYQPHWPASAHLHLTLALEDFMSSLPNCLPRNRLPSLAADSKRVRSTRVCVVYIYICNSLRGDDYIPIPKP